MRPDWIGLSWSRSTDNISQVWTTLLMDGANTDIVGFIGVQSNFVLHLQPSSTHTVQVKVGDAFGNTNQSNVVTVTYVDPGAHTFVLRAVDGSGNRSGPNNAFTVQIC